MNPFLIFLLSCVFLLSSSCGGADRDTIDMADEVCEALDKFEDIDSTNALEAAKCIFKISVKKDKYGSVSGHRFNEVIEKKCPGGYKKLMKIYARARQ